MCERTMINEGRFNSACASASAAGEARAGGAGGRLHAGRREVLGVARRDRLPLAEALQLLERQVVARQVERAVLQDARVPGGEDEPVAVLPVRVRRAVPQHL